MWLLQKFERGQPSLNIFEGDMSTPTPGHTVNCPLTTFKVSLKAGSSGVICGAQCLLPSPVGILSYRRRVEEKKNENREKKGERKEGKHRAYSKMGPARARACNIECSALWSMQQWPQCAYGSILQWLYGALGIFFNFFLLN